MGSKVWKTREVMGRWVLNGKPIEVEDGAVFFIVQKCPNEAMFPVEVSFEAARGGILRPPVEFLRAEPAHLFLFGGELFKLDGDGGRGVARQSDARGARAVEGATIVAEEAESPCPFGKIQPRFPDKLPLLFPETGLVEIFRWSGCRPTMQQRDIRSASGNLCGNDQKELEEGTEPMPADEGEDEGRQNDQRRQKNRQDDEKTRSLKESEGETREDGGHEPSDSRTPGGVKKNVEEFFHGSRVSGREVEGCRRGAEGVFHGVENLLPWCGKTAKMASMAWKFFQKLLPWRGKTGNLGSMAWKPRMGADDDRGRAPGPLAGAKSNDSPCGGREKSRNGRA